MRFLEKWRASGKRRPEKSATPKAFDLFKAKYASFKGLLEANSELLRRISDIEEKLSAREMFGMQYVCNQADQVLHFGEQMIDSFERLSGKPQTALHTVFDNIRQRIIEGGECRIPPAVLDLVLPLGKVNRDMIDWVGGKNANLGEIAGRIGIPVPAGFAVTTAAYDRFMSANGLSEILHEVDLAPTAETRQVMAVSERLRSLFDGARVPPDLENAILNAYAGVAGNRFGGSDAPLMALRSSAIGEDSALSFAGQYLSVLNVAPDQLLSAYKRILSSLFSPRAISYRLQKGVPLKSAVMAVVCIEMIDSKASGVMYTRHPFHILENTVLINAVWGLGTYAVEGIVSPDAYTLSKELPPQVLGTRIFPKEIRLASRPGGGVMEEPVAHDRQRRPCLTETQMKTLAEYGIRLERHFQTPQDIEWALDGENRLFILQSRPLRLGMTPLSGAEDADSLPAEISGHDVLLSGGDAACPGVGCGVAHIVSAEDDLLAFPENGVLVARSASPKYVMVMPKAQAIVTDSGSVTGHMASLTREFMVPALLNTETATQRIRQGDLITVDAYSRKIYTGRVPKLLEMRLDRGAFMKDTPVYEHLRNMARWIVPLNLTNPSDPGFSPKGCRTVHDIMRYLHEKSYAEMFRISDLATDRGGVAVKLDTPKIPLDLFVIDLGGGFRNVPEDARKVRTDQIASLPFSALLRGMMRDDLTAMAPRPVDLGGFFSVFTRQMLSPPNLDTERFGDKSYAIVSDKYLNFSSRVGYHYSIVDAYCGLTETKNYINFEFKGGAADDVRKNRRTRAISAILTTFGFFTDVKADRVTARINKRKDEVIEDMLDHLGRLLLFTRQMDMLMDTDQAVDDMVRCYLDGDYCLDSRFGPNSGSSASKG